MGIKIQPASWAATVANFHNWGTIPVLSAETALRSFSQPIDQYFLGETWNLIGNHQKKTNPENSAPNEPELSGKYPTPRPSQVPRAQQPLPLLPLRVRPVLLLLPGLLARERSEA